MTPEQCVRLLNDLAAKTISDPTVTSEKIGATIVLVYGLTEECLKRLWLDDATKDQLPN